MKISEKLASVEARILPAPWVMCSSYYYDYVSEKKGSWYCINCSLSLHSQLQLKYHEAGKEKDCLPQVGQWNMMNKVAYCTFYSFLINIFNYFVGSNKETS